MGAACASADLTGRWDLDSPGPPAGFPALRLRLDPATPPSPGRLRATVITAMIGNVSVPATAFLPTDAEITPRCLLRLSVRNRDMPDPLGLFEGLARPDTVDLVSLVWDGEERAATAAGPLRLVRVATPDGTGDQRASGAR